MKTLTPEQRRQLDRSLERERHWRDEHFQLVVEVPTAQGQAVTVSTIELLYGEHYRDLGGPFETCLFQARFGEPGFASEVAERYQTRVEAEAGHRRWVERVATHGVEAAAMEWEVNS